MIRLRIGPLDLAVGEVGEDRLGDLVRCVGLSGLTPWECFCKNWTSEPDGSILNRIHEMPGLNP